MEKVERYIMMVERGWGVITEKGSAGSNNIWLFTIMEKVKRYMIMAAHSQLCEGKAAY